jgi:hypothetical protein
MPFLEVYMDESISQNPARVCTVAGYIGERKEWARFSDEWQAVLKAEGVKAFHATDAESLRGEFAGWPRDRQHSLVRRLTEIVRRTPVTGYASCFYLGADQTRSRTALAFAENSYIGAFGDCVTELARLAALYIGMEDEITFVIEENRAWKARLAQSFIQLKGVPEFAERHRLSDTLAFGGKVGVTPLQVADFLAYESMKSLQNILTRPELPLRRSLMLLTRNDRTFIGTRSVFDLERAVPLKIQEWINANYKSRSGTAIR